MSNSVIAARLAKALHRYLLGEIDDRRLALGLRRLALELERTQPLGLSVPDQIANQLAKQAESVFAFWCAKMGRPKAKLTPDRKRAVVARLREGFTVEQLKRAVAACSVSDFHMGKNERETAYNDLTLVCRSGSKVEAFLELAREHGAPMAVGGGVDPETRRLEDEAARAMKEGQVDVYNRANAQLRALAAAQGREARSAG